MPDQVEYEDLIVKYRAEKEQHKETNFANSEILGDKYPHCLLVIEGVEKLYRMGARYKEHNSDGNSDTLASDYLDSLILRLDVSNHRYCDVVFHRLEHKENGSEIISQ